jgi:hypothetical protein
VTQPPRPAENKTTAGPQPWRAVAIFGFAVFFAVLGTAALVVGVHDASLNHAGFGVVATGALLLAMGALDLFAAAQLAQMNRRSLWKNGEPPPCRLPVLVAFLVTILFALYIFLTALSSSGAQWPVVVAAAILLLLCPFAGLYLFGQDARVTLPRIGAVALGLVGTAIGAWQFWYQHQYAPSHAGRAVALKVELARADTQENYDVIDASVTYTDVGDSSVSVLGSTYTLTGSRVVRCQRPSRTRIIRPAFKGFLVDPQRIRYMSAVLERGPQVLAAGKFVGDGKRLDHDVSGTRSFVFFVPHKHYQLLRFRTQLFAIPASVPLSQRTLPIFRTIPGDSDVYGLWHVDDDSWFHDLVYGRERYVVLRYELVDPKHEASPNAGPNFRVTARFPRPRWTKGTPSNERLDELFATSKATEASDASEPFADAELALAPIASPSAKEQLPRTCESSA